MPSLQATQQQKQQAVQLLEQQEFDQAKKILDKLSTSAKKDPEVWFLLSAVHGLLNLPDKAEYYSRKTIALAPGFPEAHFNLGNALRQQGKHNEAITSFEKTLSLMPEHMGAIINSAGTYEEMGQLDKAYTNYKKAQTLAPNMPSNYYNLAKIVTTQGKNEEAIELYNEALKRDPNDINSHNNLSRILLNLGRYTEGWNHYRHRLSIRETGIISPETLPDNLGGKRILLVYDQGLGDELFFLQFAPMLKERGAWLAYQPGHDKIASLFKRVDCLDLVLPHEQTLNDVDYRISIGDLPRLLGHGDNSEHPASLQIPVNQDSLDKVKKILSDFGPPPYIGVTWRAGTPKTKTALFKEFELEDLANICRPLDARIVILQRLPAEGEVEQFSQVLGRPVLDLNHYNEQLEDMLAVLSVIDDYIGVSNTNMHMRAAVGKACKVLVPFPPEWRWHVEGESPWFPGFKVYRQTVDQDWRPAIEQLSHDLTGQ